MGGARRGACSAVGAKRPEAAPVALPPAVAAAVTGPGKALALSLRAAARSLTAAAAVEAAAAVAAAAVAAAVAAVMATALASAGVASRCTATADNTSGLFLSVWSLPAPPRPTLPLFPDDSSQQVLTSQCSLCICLGWSVQAQV